MITIVNGHLRGCDAGRSPIVRERHDGRCNLLRIQHGLQHFWRERLCDSRIIACNVWAHALAAVSAQQCSGHHVCSSSLEGFAARVHVGIPVIAAAALVRLETDSLPSLVPSEGGADQTWQDRIDSKLHRDALAALHLHDVVAAGLQCDGLDKAVDPELGRTIHSASRASTYPLKRGQCDDGEVSNAALLCNVPEVGPFGRH
mmetsp:Transcript_56642/g.165672  ORF Transcript_56642/g.165672 Transcript_56642/m.165672 type:complete len:202 (+) Transcript_56642:268-873(+)